MKTSMTDNDGTHNYAYDQLYQIIEATHPTVNNPLEQFQYDQTGNWQNNGRIHNELNQLLEDDSCRYTYDPDGNMTEKINKTTSDTTYYIWDIENKLIEVRKSGIIARYTYDALGRRMKKEVNGVATKYGYDGQNLILEVNSADSIVANYTFGPGIDNPLAMKRNNKNYYYFKDGLGSVTALTDSIGDVRYEYKYSVFGKIVYETGDSIENTFTYTGREYNDESGLYYYRARYYDPVIGRFMQEDPMGIKAGDVNLFRYVSNSPIIAIDPMGLELRLYSSPAFSTFGDWGANHAFVYSTETGEQAGRNGSLGVVYGPGGGDVNSSYKVINPPPGMSEREFIEGVKNNPHLNEGLFLPVVNDCHTSMEKVFKDLGVKYPGAPNGRFDWNDDLINFINNLINFIPSNKLNYMMEVCKLK